MNKEFLVGYVGVIILWSLWCLYQYIWGNSDKSEVQRVKNWEISWLNFGIFLWCVLFMILFMPEISLLITKRLGIFFQFEHWQDIVAGFSNQLILFCGFMMFLVRYPVFAERNGLFDNSLKLKDVVRKSVFDLGLSLPFLWVSAFSWIIVVEAWKFFGVKIEVEPQLLVQLMTKINNMGFRIVLLVFAVVIAPITEELLFRGFIYRFLKGKMKPIIAMGITSILFAVGHFNLASFLPLCLLSMMLTRAYEHSGDLRVPIFMHGLFNFNTIILLLLNPELVNI